MREESQDEAVKTRIISHMNADHHDSIIRYLEHYCGLFSWTAYDSLMINISLNEMVFRCGSRQYQIPFEPPMKSYKEARERVVEMDKECLQALGKSDITVKDFVPPHGLYIFDFLVIITTLLAFSQRWWFQEGQIVERTLGPMFATFCWTIQPFLISGMMAIHSFELSIFVPQYLRKHSVNPRTMLWWKWVGTTFIEGQFAFMRFRKLVAVKRAEKEKQKH